MQGLFYLAMLIGVAWLCVWAVFPQLVSRFPSPFDMRDDDNEPVAAEPESWGDRRQPLRAEPAAAAPQKPAPQPGPAQSWRARREQAQAAGRQRRG